MGKIKGSTRYGCTIYGAVASFGVFCLAFMGIMLLHLQRERPSHPSKKPEIQSSALVSKYEEKTFEDARLRKIGATLDPEIMANVPRAASEYKLNVKNPCWDHEGTIRCLPYFYLAGSFQAGVDTLYKQLIPHRDIIHNEMTRYQFWGEEGKPMSTYAQKNGQSYEQIKQSPQQHIILDASSSTFAFYWSAGLRTHQGFQRYMKPCWSNCSDHARGKQDVREKCTSEICYPGAMAADKKVASDLGISYDDVHLPLLMAAAYGKERLPKIIVMLRNPTERLHCAYWQYAHYKGKYGESAAGFLAYVKEQIGAIRKCESRGDYSARECALYFEALGNVEEKLFFHADQIMRGMYEMYLEVWLRHFPRDHLLIIRSEEYFSNAHQTLKQVYAFLGMTNVTEEDLDKMVKAGGRGTSFTKGRPAMLDEARSLVMDFYRPWNQRLSELLGDPYYLSWNVVPQTNSSSDFLNTY
ncbi:hypothetical protein CEUSTIGMA_g9972.t1 [Chlamydomonas eustigma]|uniref:Sulfotransferase n=1 Tax=Chlamydomonas eustigma TaxID=1157962 RepID=A0A250XHR7_9CHLO|nr:hypothetical protein CEUSTIGMA_g9972.t1 [Chlamydomonas eustigma]|eukprot:GAX82546.1 hypothetical protein CEUSTIGMA_g9972.t1 [Chlamydomonas eustigma]